MEKNPVPVPVTPILSTVESHRPAAGLVGLQNRGSDRERKGRLQSHRRLDPVCQKRCLDGREIVGCQHFPGSPGCPASARSATSSKEQWDEKSEKCDDDESKGVTGFHKYLRIGNFPGLEDS